MTDLRDIDWQKVDVDWLNLWEGLAMYDSSCAVCTRPIVAGQWIVRAGGKGRNIVYHAEHHPLVKTTVPTEGLSSVATIAGQLVEAIDQLSLVLSALSGMVAELQRLSGSPGCASDGPAF